MITLFGHILAPDDLGLGVVTVERGTVVGIEPGASAPAGALGGESSLITPGFIDLQVNGAFGHDFSEPDADVAAVCRRLPQFGVAAFLGTVISSPPDRYRPCLENLRRPQFPGEARLLGVHVEGPFLSPEQPGTHDPAALRAPDRAEALSWLDAGDVRVITLAPELPGAVALIAELAARGVVAAAGHTSASWKEAHDGFRAGIRLGTHVFNAMRPFHHRDPSVAGALLAAPVAVSVIADGVHVAPETLALVASVKGPERVVVVSDGLAGMGMPPGAYQLAGRVVVSDGTSARLADGTLSGSVTPIPSMLATLVRAGVPPSTAVAAATRNPARVLGMGTGVIGHGARADLVVLDEGWGVNATLIGGEIAWLADAVVA